MRVYKFSLLTYLLTASHANFSSHLAARNWCKMRYRERHSCELRVNDGFKVLTYLEQAALHLNENITVDGFSGQLLG